jgi:hypothetical protein
VKSQTSITRKKRILGGLENDLAQRVLRESLNSYPGRAGKQGPATQDKNKDSFNNYSPELRNPGLNYTCQRQFINNNDNNLVFYGLPPLLNYYTTSDISQELDQSPISFVLVSVFHSD